MSRFIAAVFAAADARMLLLLSLAAGFIYASVASVPIGPVLVVGVLGLLIVVEFVAAMPRYLTGGRALAVAFATGILLSAPIAHAASTTAVTLPIGDWISSLASYAPEIIAGLIAWLLRKLPAQLVDLIKVVRADQLLERALGAGINAVAGAERGKTLTVDVGSQVAAAAAQYAIDNGPVWLTNWLGGPAGLVAKVVARLQLEPTAAIGPEAVSDIAANVRL